MSADDCCSDTCCSTSSQNMNHDNSIPIKKTVQILDNELRLRSLTNTTDCNHSIRNSCTIHTILNHTGRFDELTNFFNIISGLFRQSAFTLGLSTYHLTSLFCLPEINVGMNMHIDQQSIEEHQIDLLKNMTLYSLIGKNTIETVGNNKQQQNLPSGIVKFHTADKTFMMSVNHRWTPSLTSTCRFGTKPQNRLWSHIEYRSSHGIYELIGQYNIQQQRSSNIQFSCLSCLCQRMNYQIDAGIDIKITSQENLVDIGVRLKRSSDSIVFKCDLYHPLKTYLIGIQRSINTNCTVGLLVEKVADHNQQQQQTPIKFSFMSGWYLNQIDVQLNLLVNTHNELGVAVTHQIRRFPLMLQIFGLYSWTTYKYKWGIGLQLLL